ncbi:NACHT, LRR and PYD domains-containing protein 1b allele 2-like [Dendropsophus ebraccatus]|uniref:NACHT, LRR and PYD domains-containing protein 1b allele 2-like n=1 Tax=Dendropsophus ebraccatus TaxID=150705 RepID=UPI0038318C47
MALTMLGYDPLVPEETSQETMAKNKENIATGQETITTSPETISIGQETSQETMATSQETMAKSQETMETSQETTATSQETITTSPETILIGQETTATSQETTATSQETTATSQETTVTSQETMATNQETMETSQETMRIEVDEINCKLCGKNDEDLAEVVSTTDSNNRLELKSPGLYRCQKTGIKFLVNRPVIIECKLDSWSDHLKDIQISSYEILGPLFNIKTLGDPNAVSAVYLPHYLCLKGFNGDTALIKCAHFKNGNLTLETPTQINPYYITLENPVFSLLGIILAIKRKNIKIHGMVLLYFTILGEGESNEEHRILLYTLPYTTNVEETIDKKNKEFGYKRIKKREHTDTVYRKKSYLITGSPGVSVLDKTLKFQTEPYQFTELQLTEKDVTIDLSVSDENTKNPVWETRLTQHDMKTIAQSLSRLKLHKVAGAHPTAEHFVDRHRRALIERMGGINSILDVLLEERLLTTEQYGTVQSMRPQQEAMRQLYDYTRAWGPRDKDKLYEALREYNNPLIRDLESRDTIEL